MELLPHALADTGQAPMLGLLEDQGKVFQGGLLGSLGGRVGLEEGQSGRSVEQARTRSTPRGNRF